MQIAPYLSFNGGCEAAFALYAECLGGTVGELFRYAGSPMADQVPADWQDKIMHGSVTIGGHTIMGADMAEQFESVKGMSLSIHLKDARQAERIFQQLARDGRIVMPLEKTFWASRFGMLVDKFGVPWSINCE